MVEGAHVRRASGRRRWVAVSLVAALAVGGGAVAYGVWGLGGSGVDCSVSERSSVAEASAAAIACDAPVEVLSERSPWASVFAQPDGTSMMMLDAVPQRTRVAGEWVPVDTSILSEPRGDVPAASGGGSQPGDGASIAWSAGSPLLVPGTAGMLPVAAPVFPMWVNPGGPAGAGLPLGVIQRDARWMSLWFPLPLGVPMIEGHTISYDLGPGARLVIIVISDGAGFRPIVELDSPAAAAWFQGALEDARALQGLPGEGFEIPYRVEASSGLMLREIEDSGFELVDISGEVLFWSPPSVMWDSAAGETEEDRREFPANGDRAVVMPVRVDDATSTVVVSPDEDMLASAGTVWPVRIDPTTGARTPAEWVMIRTGGYTSPKYKWTDTADRKGESMGRCLLSWSSACNVNFTARLVWEFGGLSSLMTELTGDDIVSATFSAAPGGRGNCTSARTDAYATSDIVSTSPSWSSITFSSLQAYVTGPQGTACSDNGVRRSFDVKPAVITAADTNDGTISFGLRANSETSSNGYKTYQANAQLEIVYNRAPYEPAAVKLASPVKACEDGEDRPFITTATPTLSAKVTDPDGGNVQALFQVLDPDTQAVVWDSGMLAPMASDSTFNVAVPGGALTDGQTYQYRAMGSDGTRTSGWSPDACEFTIDATAPAMPTVAAVRTGPGITAIYEENVERGGVGLVGKFMIDAGISDDVVSFHYYFTDTMENKSTPVDEEGLAVIEHTPTSAGPVTLWVFARDAAENDSDPTPYKFDVAAAKEDAVWMLDEGAGDTAADTSGMGGAAKALTISGATWTTGPHDLFQSRPGDGALLFDGVDDEATAAPIVDTEKSFVISTYVWLDASAIGNGTHSALSQDGTVRSAFDLSYLPACAGMTGGCWSFGMADEDDTEADEARVVSPVPVTGDQWVHLVAAHHIDQENNRKIQLWVCEIGTPDDPRPGEPVYTDLTRTASTWTAAGAFALGRSLDGGARANWWPGRIDNVRVFSGQVVAEAKIRRMCQGAEARDFTTGLDVLDPTTTNGE